MCFGALRSARGAPEVIDNGWTTRAGDWARDGDLESSKRWRRDKLPKGGGLTYLASAACVHISLDSRIHRGIHQSVLVRGTEETFEVWKLGKGDHKRGWRNKG